MSSVGSYEGGADENYDADIVDAIMNAATSNANYFSSYEDVSVHELMLKDKPRTMAYLEAIQKNKHMFEGKVVLDVGAGTGILSMFAAKHGNAKRVFAVEASGMAKHAEALVKHNKLDHIITVIQSTVETVELPEGFDKVDVIISEWMGFYLLHESMLDSVIFARDRFLKPDTGIMFPSSARILAAPVDLTSLYAEKFGFWEDVYGFDFSPLQQTVAEAFFSKPYVGIIKPEQLLTSEPYDLVMEFECGKITKEDLREVSALCKFKATKEGTLHGFCIWFDVFFDDPNSNSNKDKSKSVRLATGPGFEDTHWKQTTILLPGQAFNIVPGMVIPVILSMVSDYDSENYRHYSLSVEFNSEDDDDDDDDAQTTEEQQQQQ